MPKIKLEAGTHRVIVKIEPGDKPTIRIAVQFEKPVEADRIMLLDEPQTDKTYFTWDKANNGASFILSGSEGSLALFYVGSSQFTNVEFDVQLDTHKSR